MAAALQVTNHKSQVTKKMKRQSTLRTQTAKVRSSLHVLLLACCIGCLSGCGNDIEKLKMFEPQTLPDNTIRNAHIQRSEYGRLQLLMEAPIIEQYSQPEAKTIYPQGVNMRFFDGYNNPTATLTARYGISNDSRNTMTVRDSVVIVDLRSGDTTYLQELTWDSEQHLIFSDKPLRSKNGQRVTYGDGFESDDNLQSPLILHQRGTIEWKEE